MKIFPFFFSLSYFTILYSKYKTHSRENQFHVTFTIQLINERSPSYPIISNPDSRKIKFLIIKQSSNENGRDEFKKYAKKKKKRRRRRRKRKKKKKKVYNLHSIDNPLLDQNQSIIPSVQFKMFSN
jgi:hypothetical protein